MVRLSKQKQEKLESIMNLVEQLGVDRVLGRLRQTKMMSKDVLDDMKEWETDYEKRVALLGFLVSPEGKRAFGALFELAKVHEEQVKMQEEQEKLRQEQMAQQQHQPAEVKRPTAGHGATGGGRSGVDHRQTGGSSMKNKLRAQLHKKRVTNTAPSQQQDNTSSGNNGKSKKGSKNAEDKVDPLLEEAARTLEEAERLEKEKKRIEAYRSQLAASEANDPPGSAGNRRGGSPRRTPTPSTMSETQGNEEVGSEVSKPPKKRDGRSPSVERNTTHPGESPKHERVRKASEGSSSPAPKHVNFKLEPKKIDLHIEGSSSQLEKEIKGEKQVIQGTAGDKNNKKDELRENEEYAIMDRERLPPEGENVTDHEVKQAEDEFQREERTEEEEQRSRADSVTNQGTSGDEMPTTDNFTPHTKLMDTLAPIVDREIDLNEVRGLLLADIVAEWRMLRKEREKFMAGIQGQAKATKQLKEELRSMSEERNKMQKEKDKFVFKEFELQQKLGDLQQKHRSLREDHDALKQGNHQIQQNTKKANKVHQDMKKKIAKLESKIKSMDKVTVRRGTQTDEQLDKNVHEALRMAEESLAVNQTELSSVQSKLKNAQQEVDDFKKQVNLKGREINKRERKSKRDEEQIRLVSRERDAMEAKLRKVSEQMEYYKTMMEMKVKGSKRPQEKKEVKVQRCASGRHVMIKSVPTGITAASCHANDNESDGALKSPSRRPSTVKIQNQSKTKQSEGEKTVTTPRKGSQQQQQSSQADNSSSQKQANGTGNSEGTPRQSTKPIIKSKSTNGNTAGSKSAASTPRSTANGNNVTDSAPGTPKGAADQSTPVDSKSKAPTTPRKGVNTSASEESKTGEGADEKAVSSGKETVKKTKK